VRRLCMRDLRELCELDELGRCGRAAACVSPICESAVGDSYVGRRRHLCSGCHVDCAWCAMG
jgi:hypothetical protein